MQPVPLESTLLASVSYDGQRHLLDVVFRSGELYRYFNVPSACYRAFLGLTPKEITSTSISAIASPISIYPVAHLLSYSPP